MRSDLAKCLTERERVRSSMSYKTVRRKNNRIRLDADGDANMPRQQGMYRPHTQNHGETKSFTDVLSPLRGAVQKAVGKRWDKFYSELCKTVDRRSVQGAHVFEHVYDFCELEIQVIDGELWTKPAAYGSAIYRVKEDRTIQFYVDPRDGIIKRNKAYRGYSSVNREIRAREAAKKLETCRVIDKNTELHKIDGTWFVCEFAMTPLGKWREYGHPGEKPTKFYDAPMVWDCLLGKNVATQAPRSYRHITTPAKQIVYCKSKRTASHKFLKQHGVIS